MRFGIREGRSRSARTSTMPKLSFALPVLLFSASLAIAGNWPQILGPDRNGHAINEKLADDWSQRKPERLWTLKVGEGYAGPAIQGQRVLLFHRLGRQEVLTCVSADQGEPIWETRWSATYAGGVDSDQGPRCVPLVHQGQVFVFGAAGELHCASLQDGKKLWSRKLGREYKAQDGYFGAGSCPIIAADKLLVNVGGRGQASIVAIDLASGATLWKTFQDHASYSSPTLRTPGNSGNDSAAVFITRLHLVGLAANDGKVLFQFPFGKTGPTVNAATPLMLDEDRVFVTASYGIGAKLLSLTGGRPKVLWESDDALSSQYPTPVLHDGHLFGIHGREDGPPAELRCIDANTGKVSWRQAGMGMAHLIIADNKLLVAATSGELHLLALDNSRYRELGRVKVSTATARAQPALADGRLFVRDTDGNIAAWKLP